MKKNFLVLSILLVVFSLSACVNKTDIPINPISAIPNNTYGNKTIKKPANDIRIKLAVNDQQVIIKLYDNPASKDLLTLLPLTLTFKDYLSNEKISGLPQKLTTQGTEEDNSKTDDFAYFAPWGNLAIFYKRKQQGGNGLVILGTIESGKAILANIKSDFTATLEIIN